ncbi:anaerobic C4-dicarboxylate transporter [Escherichia coli]
MGARLGGIGIGFAGGLGVLVLAAIGVKPGNIPFDVISIIMAVIAAISAMQVAGGLDYLVHQTEKLLRRNPKYITILAPIVTYFLTIFAGTGNISLATLPVIAEVAKEQGVKPCRPLSTAVVSAQIAITASPISAAVVYMSSVMEGHGISYLHLLSVVIPSTLLAVLVMSFLVTMLFDSNSLTIRFIASVWKRAWLNCAVKSRLKSNPVQKRPSGCSCWRVVGVVIYAIINSQAWVLLLEKPLMNTTNAILIIMLSVATLTTVICKVSYRQHPQLQHLQSRYERLDLYPGCCVAGRYFRFQQHRLDQRYRW